MKQAGIKMDQHAPPKTSTVTRPSRPCGRREIMNNGLWRAFCRSESPARPGRPCHERSTSAEQDQPSRRPDQRRTGLRGFTLVELMISIAMVLLLILGINAIFR